MKLDLQQVSYLLYWMKERHAIHKRRESGAPRPWTTDSILQEYFFTNPYRENDKTTRWFAYNFRDSNRSNAEVVMGTIIFRRFNYIPTGEILKEHLLLRHWDSRVAYDVLHNQEKVFTGAFMISSPNYKPKLPEILRMIDAQWARRTEIVEAIRSDGTLAGSWKILQSEHHKGLMPYEVVTDLRHTDILCNAPDIDTWAYFGPGGQRGVGRVLGLDMNRTKVSPRSMEQSVCLTVGAELLQIARRSLPDMHAEMPIEMREIEHSLCEYDKYMRALKGGNMKRRFDGC